MTFDPKSAEIDISILTVDGDVPLAAVHTCHNLPLARMCAHDTTISLTVTALLYAEYPTELVLEKKTSLSSTADSKDTPNSTCTEM